MPHRGQQYKFYWETLPGARPVGWFQGWGVSSGWSQVTRLYHSLQLCFLRLSISRWTIFLSILFLELPEENNHMWKFAWLYSCWTIHPGILAKDRGTLGKNGWHTYPVIQGPGMVVSLSQLCWLSHSQPHTSLITKHCYLGKLLAALYICSHFGQSITFMPFCLHSFIYTHLINQFIYMSPFFWW